MKNDLAFSALVGAIGQVHGHLTAHVKAAVNVSLTIRNWLIGYYIDEYELQGADRAEYGENLFEALAQELKPLKVSAAGRRQLCHYLSFYRTYPQIVRTLSGDFTHVDQSFHAMPIS